MILNCNRCVLLKSVVLILNKSVQIVRMGSNEVMRKIQSDLKDTFYAGVTAVLPHKLIEDKVTFKCGKYLCVDDQSFFIKDNVYIVGFGKAVMSMALALEQILGDKIRKGIISVPHGSVEKHLKFTEYILKSKLEFYEAGLNNQPDECSLQTTKKIIDLLRSSTKCDTIIVLVSGGGSALLVKPKFPITLQEKQQLCQKLQNAGAGISELNTVRIALSEVKGGGLARIAHPSFLISLILSDIIGDPINLIASGPTVFHEQNSESVLNILQKYNLLETLPVKMKNIITSIKNDDSISLSDLSVFSDHDFQHVSNLIIGNNSIAIERAREEIIEKGLKPVILSNCIKGNVRLVSRDYADLVSYVCDTLNDILEESAFIEKVQNISTFSLSKNKAKDLWQLLKKSQIEGIVLIGGGEPTVEVQGTGKGGRNQELALTFSLDWSDRIKLNADRGKYDVVMLSAGTDGQDGPTDAAGAFGYPQIETIILNIKTKLLEAKKVVDKNLDTCIDLKAVEEVKEFQNSVLNENKKYIDKYFIENILQQVNLLEPKHVLDNNDTYSFYSKFRKGKDLIKCGITGTNVMDLHFIYIRKKQCCCPSNYDEVKSNVFLEHDLGSYNYSNVKEVENKL